VLIILALVTTKATLPGIWHKDIFLARNMAYSWQGQHSKPMNIYSLGRKDMGDPRVVA
jgi:hypothetical protein